MCKKFKNNMFLVSFLLILSIFLSSCNTSAALVPLSENEPEAITDSLNNKLMDTQPEIAAVSMLPQTLSVVKSPVTGMMSVHYLDVGQADSILIQLPDGEIMLIDAGNNEDALTIITYLQSLGISKIDYLIGTHPHEDHIGGLDDIINNFDIKSLYMPNVIQNTQTFEDVLLAVAAKGLTVNTAKDSANLLDYANLKADFIAPTNDTYAELNNYSAVIKLDYGETSFLFTGDAEILSETEILFTHADIQADVLKIAHHGSDSSTSDEFLRVVNPEYAIISCGVNNTYGHPNTAILERLVEHNISVYRTDISGTIVLTSDGQTIQMQEPIAALPSLTAPMPTGNTPIPTAALTPTPSQDTISAAVYVTKTGAKYHRGSCQYLSNSKIPIILSSAKNQGYTACSKCNPPK